MGVISWIILGLIAGFIGSKIVNKTGSGMFMDIALGVVGAIVGGFLASLLGIGGVTGVNIGSIIIAVIGAVVVLEARPVFGFLSSRLYGSKPELPEMVLGFSAALLLCVLATIVPIRVALAQLEGVER